MNILDKIIEHKRLEIAQRKKDLPVEELTRYELFQRPTNSLKNAIQNGNGVIAEFKRKSPSAGLFEGKELNEVIQKYESTGVSGCSILTDFEFFGGTVSDLVAARNLTERPILRKEFIIDEYQLFEAKAHGADAVLLIAAVLDNYHATHLTTIANSLGLEVLMEFHAENELDKLNDGVDIIGINNRNLDTLETSIETSERMLRHLPFSATKITESGIHNAAQLKYLYDIGFDGCLIGESLLKTDGLIDEMIKEINHLKLMKNAH